MHHGRRRLPGVWGSVDSDSQLVPAIPCRRAERRTARRTPVMSSAVPMRERLVPPPDLRGTDNRPRPQAWTAHRATAFHPGRSRSRPGRPGRCPAGCRPRRGRWPEHGVAPGRCFPEPEVRVPRVVGVDEYATRKGRHYGTVLDTLLPHPRPELNQRQHALRWSHWCRRHQAIAQRCRYPKRASSGHQI